MSTIILITAMVICGDEPAKKYLIETNQRDYTHDLQLIRMGWWDHENERRCKAVKMRYETLKESV